MFTNRFSKIIVAIIVVTVALATASMIPAGPAPSTSEAAHVQYLNGEKAIYSGGPELGDVMQAYRLGEKNIVSVLESAILDYRRGEKASSVPAIDLSSVLWAYHLGEKTLYTNSADFDNALSAWRFGEKAVVRSNVLEAALSTWRQGEKDAK